MTGILRALTDDAVSFFVLQLDTGNGPFSGDFAFDMRSMAPVSIKAALFFGVSRPLFW